MAKDKHKDQEAGVYRIVDVIGVSTSSWEDAATSAVETVAKSLRKVEDGKVVAFRTRLALSFKYEK
jgi:dodecin